MATDPRYPLQPDAVAWLLAVAQSGPFEIRIDASRGFLTIAPEHGKGWVFLLRSSRAPDQPSAADFLRAIAHVIGGVA